MKVRLISNMIVILMTICLVLIVFYKLNSVLIYTNEIYNADQVEEDLKDFRKEIKKVHPQFMNKEFEEQFEKKYEYIVDNLNDSITRQELFFMISELTAMFNDSNTYVDLPFEQYHLPIDLVWINNELIISKSYCDLKKGDKIIEINNVEVNEIYFKLANVISSENDYWTRYQVCNFVKEKFVLNWLGCLNRDNTVTIKVMNIEGEVKEKIVELEETDYETKYETVGYKFYKKYSTAILALNKCDENYNYKKAFDEFFDYVEENQISKIVVDLRRNTGGDFTVFNEFLKYIDIDEYEYFYSINKNNTKTIKITHSDSKLYDGKIYIATSNKTFDSAVLFSGIIKYNNIGLTIGQPTGNATIRYGEPKIFTLPNSKLKYYVSSARLGFSNVKDKSTIEPDIYLEYTIQDIVESKDPLEKWIKNNNYCYMF